MIGDIAGVIAKIRSRQLRLTENHPQMSTKDRQQLSMTLSVNEAAALADVVADSFSIGKFDLWRAGEGKIGITLHGDGEGGEFSEAELAAVVMKFYQEQF